MESWRLCLRQRAASLWGCLDYDWLIIKRPSWRLEGGKWVSPAVVRVNTSHRLKLKSHCFAHLIIYETPRWSETGLHVSQLSVVRRLWFQRKIRVSATATHEIRRARTRSFPFCQFFSFQFNFHVLHSTYYTRFQSSMVTKPFSQQCKGSGVCTFEFICKKRRKR